MRVSQHYGQYYPVPAVGVAAVSDRRRSDVFAFAAACSTTAHAKPVLLAGNIANK